MPPTSRSAPAGACRRGALAGGGGGGGVAGAAGGRGAAAQRAVGGLGELAQDVAVAGLVDEALAQLVDLVAQERRLLELQVLRRRLHLRLQLLDQPR